MTDFDDDDDNEEILIYTGHHFMFHEVFSFVNLSNKTI